MNDFSNATDADLAEEIERRKNAKINENTTTLLNEISDLFHTGRITRVFTSTRFRDRKSPEDTDETPVCVKAYIVFTNIRSEN